MDLSYFSPKNGEFKMNILPQKLKSNVHDPYTFHFDRNAFYKDPECF